MDKATLTETEQIADVNRRGVSDFKYWSFWPFYCARLVGMTGTTAYTLGIAIGTFAISIQIGLVNKC